MPHTRSFVSVWIVSILVGGIGCSASSPPLPADTANKAADVPSPNQGIDVSSPSLEQCPAGGQIYSVFLDENHDGLFNINERVLSSQIVCNGQNGVNGINGINGHGLVFESLPASPEVCRAGGTTLLLAIDLNDSGIYDPLAPNQQSLTLCNGADAEIPAYSTVEPILPCGNTVPYKEVLLRLQNGQVLGSFSSDATGTMTRLAFLPDGSFLDTDSSNCTFTLATSADLRTRSISWLGQVQMTWSMPDPN